MAMGIVNDDDLLKEMDHLKVVEIKRVPSVDVEVVEKNIEHGRGIGRKNVDEKVREEIASEAICGADVDDLVEQFGISKSSISAYKNGSTSTASYNEPKSELLEANKNVKNKITGLAQNKLIEALKSINLNQDGLKPQIASAIAKDMSSIMKNMDDGGLVINNNQQVIIYKPRMKEEDNYDVIDVVN